MVTECTQKYATDLMKKKPGKKCIALMGGSINQKQNGHEQGKEIHSECHRGANAFTQTDPIGCDRGDSITERRNEGSSHRSVQTDVPV